MNIKSILIFVAVTVGILAGVGGLLWQFGQTTDKPIEDVAGERKHVQGSGSVTLVEFSDFQCPACFSVQEPLKQILAKYEGKVELVFRHFPLSSIHKNAQIAAQAVEAAGLQGKFFEMHDKLFSTQAVWQGLSDPREIFASYAKELVIDEGKWVSDMESQGVKEAINVDLMAATRYRLSGTPSFFLNGVAVEFDQIETRIEDLIQ